MMPKDPEEKINNEIKPEDELPEATTTPEEELAEAKKKAEEYLANWQRAQADFINYKRRTEQERLEFNSYANANLLCAILPVLDDLERALKAIPREHKNDDWVEGVRLVEKKFKTILEGQGVKQIRCLGQPFDPNLHEAIRQEKGKEGIVVGEYLKGYTLNDKLLRASRVTVGNGEVATKKTHTKEETEEFTPKVHPEAKKEAE
jgi:molecular chaperone GrpE